MEEQNGENDFIVPGNNKENLVDVSVANLDQLLQKSISSVQIKVDLSKFNVLHSIPENVDLGTTDILNQKIIEEVNLSPRKLTASHEGGSNDLVSSRYPLRRRNLVTKPEKISKVPNV